MNPFEQNGTDIAQCFGRSDLIQKIRRRLVKDRPDLLSLVGPRRYGKTVLLHHLAKIFVDGVDGYVGATVVTLKSRKPQSDNEFLEILCEHVKQALQLRLKDMADLLEDLDEASYFDSLKLVFENLRVDQKLLIIFDSFDRLPIGTGISSNLLDQLRVLASLPTFAVVIGSRQRLREICNTEETRLSDFWGLFRDPMDIGAFSKATNWDDLWAPFESRSITVEKGARTELINWTGGIPELVSGVLRRLYDDVADGANLNKDALLAASNQVLKSDIVDELWCDLDSNLQQQVSEGVLTKNHLKEAELRGIATFSGDHGTPCCKIINEYAKLQLPVKQQLTLLFETQEAYRKNICEVLRIRIEGTICFDRQLKEYVKKAIHDLGDEVPGYVFDRCRGIIEESVRVIWKNEGLAEQTKLPEAWIDKWEKQGHTVPSGMDPLPSDRGPKLRVLRYIAGSTQEYPRVAKDVSRHTIMLLDQLNSAGNYQGHRHGENSRFGAACSMCFTAIELLESIAADLNAP